LAPITLKIEIVKECDGCKFSGPRIIGGGETIICRRFPYPIIQWWFDQKCEYYENNKD